MIREIYFFLRHGPAVRRRRNELGLVEFHKELARKLDEDGFARLRAALVGDLAGDVLEIGAGTGATFGYYGPRARVTAIEPSDAFRPAAVAAAKGAAAPVRVLAATAEQLPFGDGAFDAVVASQVLCSVASPRVTLGELRRVLRSGGEIRLLEHVRSEHWLAGPLMDLLDPVWLRLNEIGCHWNRRTVEEVEGTGLAIRAIEPYKIFSRSLPFPFPGRLIRARNPGRG